MTTYNTGNSIGSTDPRDLYDNAQNLDTAMHTPETTWTDRLGNARQSWAGATGYQQLGDYAAGIQVTMYNQVIRASGEYWRAAAGTALPYTTTGTGMPESGKFVSVGDAIIRADLVAAGGSDIVGFQQAGAGAVVRTAQDKMREWVSVNDFGAVGDGVADDSDAIEEAINSGGARIDFGAGQYKITRPIALYTSGVELVGRGATITQVSVNTHALIIGQNLASAYAQVQDVSITGLRMYGSDDGQGSSYGCAIVVRAPATDPYAKHDGCNRIRIERNLFSGWCMSTIATGVTTLHWHKNVSRDTYYHAPLVAGGYGLCAQTCFGVFITGNHFISVAKSSPSTTTDRHAIYISSDAARPLGTNNVSREVHIANNDFDWQYVHGVTSFEGAVNLRSPIRCTVANNTILGGNDFGINHINENGANYGVTITGNTITDVNGSGIKFQKGSGSNITKEVAISGNTCRPKLAASGGDSSGVSLANVDSATVSCNVINATDSISYGININGGCTNITLLPNTINVPSGTRALSFSGTGNNSIDIGKQLIVGAADFFRYYFFTVPTNLRFNFARAFSVVANGSGSVTLSAGYASPAVSVASDANGFVVTFNGSVDVNAIGISMLSQASSVGQMYLRSKGSDTITFGVTNHSGAPLPADTNAYTIQISIPY